MRSDRETALSLILAHEGGKVDNPKDPGGRTNKGVTQRVFDAYRVARGLPKLDVWKISAEDVTRIYQDQYLDTIDYDRLPAGLNYAVADYAVNSGPARAIKDLQRELAAMCPDLKVSIDGAMGNVTRAAIARIVEKGRVGDLVVSYCERRMRFMRSLKHWPTFKNGWTRRVMGKKTGAQPGQDNGVVDYALAMVYGADLQTRPHQIGSFPEEEMGGKALPADMATLKTVEGVGAVTASATGTLVVLGQVMDELSPLVDAPILGDSIKVIMAVLGCTSAALLVYSAIRNLSAKRQGV